MWSTAVKVIGALAALIAAIAGLSALVDSLCESGVICSEPSNESEPVARFSVDPASGPAPLNVSLVNQSVGEIDEFLWNFGDGGDSEREEPIHHVFAEPGNYSISLIVRGPGGDDRVSHRIQVTGGTATPTPAAVNTPTHTPTTGQESIPTITLTRPPISTATNSPTPILLPDLIVSEFSMDPYPPTQGEPVTVRLGVYNQGAAASGSYVVEWWAGENYANPACEWNVEHSNAGGGRILTCVYDGYPSWYARLGTKIVVDVNGAVTESDESNNEERREIQVLQPSLTEDCLPFVTGEIRLIEESGNWTIVGRSRMLYFGSNESEAREALDIILYYQMNDQCFVGRPDPSLEYWLVNDSSPVGSYSGEDCLSFDRSNIEVVNINGRWMIVDGSQRILDFAASEQEAKESFEILQYYGFDHICFVGRPDPPMIYFRR